MGAAAGAGGVVFHQHHPTSTPSLPEPDLVIRVAGKHVVVGDHTWVDLAKPDRHFVPADLDPGEVQARLLEAYAVDVLPLERVETLFRLPRTPDPPPHAPTIRSVPAAES